MKLLALLLTLIPTLALADFMPGRVRPLFQADMKVVEATGVFSSWEGAVLQQNFQDDNGFVSLSLVTKEGKTILLPVSKQENTGCGNFAWSQLRPSGQAQLVAEFSDFSSMICGKVENTTWKLRLSFSAPNGQVSVFEAVGEPEGLFVTF